MLLVSWLVSFFYTLEHLATGRHSANLNVLTIGVQGLYTLLSFYVPPPPLLLDLGINTQF